MPGCRRHAQRLEDAKAIRNKASTRSLIGKEQRPDYHWLRIGSAFRSVNLTATISLAKSGVGMRRRASTAIGLLVLSQFAFANLSSALAQAGSTGGIVGNENKSVSGVTSHAAPPSRRPDAGEQETGRSCGRIVGTWSWYLGVSESVFLKDGTARHSASGTTGKWTCAGDTVNVVWSSNGAIRTDRITLSQDGNSILVVSPWGGGIRFTGTRR
jgi:hypothetical protein